MTLLPVPGTPSTRHPVGELAVEGFEGGEVERFDEELVADSAEEAFDFALGGGVADSGVAQTEGNWTGNFTFQGMRLDGATGLVMADYRFVLLNHRWSGVDDYGFAAGGCQHAEDFGE